MKRFLNIVLLAVFALATIACDKDNMSATYTQDNANLMSISGSKALSYQLGLEESSATWNLDNVQINRASGEGDVTVNLVTAVTGNATVTVDPVSFASGQTTATTKMQISGVELGATVTVKVSIPDANANPIEGAALSFTVTVKRSKPASWVPVTTKSIFKNGLVGMFSVDPDGQYAPYCTYPVQVEKRSDANIFRIKNVAKSENWELCAPEEDLPGDSYMVIDATDPNNVFVDRFPLNIDWGYGNIYAGHISAYGGAAASPGVFDAANGIITFPANTLGCDMPDYGTSVWYCFETILYLDENTMGLDYNRDYTFAQLSNTVSLVDMTRGRGSKSIYVGVPNDESKTEELKEKHGTVYAIPSYMARDYNIFFAIDEKGKFNIPEEYASQELGVELLNGVELYMNISKASSFDVASGILTLVYDLVTNDDVTIKTFTDVFYLTSDETAVADYPGNYKTLAGDTPVVIADDPTNSMLVVDGVTELMPLPFVYAEELAYPALQTGIYGDVFCGVYYPAQDGYYTLKLGQSFDLVMTAAGVVAVVPSADAYSMALELCMAKLTASGSLSSPKIYDYSTMVFVPEATEALNVSEMVNSNVTIDNDESAPLVSNAVVNGQQLVVKQKSEASNIKSLNKERMVK